MKIILFGAPNVGKGTQAALIESALGIPPISTGSLIREAMANGTEAGKAAKEFVSAGKLVPDEIVVGILKDRLAQDDCKNGFILDGFPRNVSQAETLEKMGVEIDLVISLEVPDEELENRARGRRACLCGETYHTEYNPPKQEGVCDKCGKALFVRDDDKPETVRSRLEVFHAQTEPVKAFYAQRGKVHIVDSSGAVEETTAQTRKILGIS